jgi:hypothetical protein
MFHFSSKEIYESALHRRKRVLQFTLKPLYFIFDHLHLGTLILPSIIVIHPSRRISVLRSLLPHLIVVSRTRVPRIPRSPRKNVTTAVSRILAMRVAAGVFDLLPHFDIFDDCLSLSTTKLISPLLDTRNHIIASGIDCNHILHPVIILKVHVVTPLSRLIAVSMLLFKSLLDHVLRFHLFLFGLQFFSL